METKEIIETKAEENIMPKSKLDKILNPNAMI